MSGPRRVAVAGGGIGGLALAVALQQAGHDPVVCERTARYGAAGAAISVWSNGMKVLHRLGLGAAVEAAGGRMTAMAYAAADGTALCRFSLQPLYDAVGQRAVPVARADLQAILAGALDPGRVRLGAAVTGVSTDGTALVLADGTEVGGDVVVGADGVHSAVRAYVAGPVERLDVGYVNLNTLCDVGVDVVAPGDWVTWVGGGKRASVMPAGAEGQYVFFDIPGAPAHPSTDATAELGEAFAGWGPQVQALIAAIDPSRVNRVPIGELPVGVPWHRGRVVLLGDAVHAMAPDLGQGGCQALEDAWVLAGLLSDGSDVEVALAAYEEQRAPRTAEIVRRARKRAAITHAEDPAVTEGWYRSLAGDDGTRTLAGLAESVLTGPLG